MATLLGYLLIFAARVTDVSMATIRTLLVVRGQRLQAAAIGFFEVMVYILALQKVVGQLNNPFNLLVYALGFATGNYVGSFLEEKLAMGLLSVQIITSKADETLAETIRDHGFGVTEIRGIGREGTRQILMISLHRKALPVLNELIDSLDPDAFVTVLDTRKAKGGVFVRKGK